MACHSKSLSSFVSGLASTLAVAVPVLLLAALLSVAPLPSVALAEDEPEYLALGDSITWGYEPGGGQLGDECFVSLLAAGKGYSFANEGVVGNTASGILDQLDSGELDGKVAAARVITITCGGNDLMRLVYEKTAALYNKTYPSQPISADDVTTILSNPEDPRYNTVRLDAYYVIAYTKIDESEEFAAALDTFVSNLNQVTARIRALSPDARVYVSTQYNPYEHFSGTYKLVGKYMGLCAAQLRQRVIDNARAGGYTVADVYSAFLGMTKTCCNASEDPFELDFHPSVAGHAVIADTFASVMPDVATVTPDSPTKVYGEDDPELTATVSGADESALSYLLSRRAGEDVGTYEISASGAAEQGGYLVSYGTGILTVKAKSIVPDAPGTPEGEGGGVTASSLDDVAYDGAAHRQAPTIRDSKTGRTLVEGKDYELSYAGDTTGIGMVTVSVRGIGNYTGGFDLSYRIVASDEKGDERGDEGGADAESVEATPATGDPATSWQCLVCALAIGTAAAAIVARLRMLKLSDGARS